MSKSQINLRGDTELKNKLQEIANKKATSLNEVSIQALTEFVENYELEQVKDDEIPSAKAAKKMLDAAREELIASCRAKIKSSINQMISNGKSHTFVRLFSAEIDIATKDEIAKLLKGELVGKGYITHVFLLNFDAPFNETGRLSVQLYDMAIALNDEAIEPYLDSESAALQANSQ